MVVKSKSLKGKLGRQLQETFQIKKIVKLNEIDVGFLVGKLKIDISRFSDINLLWSWYKNTNAKENDNWTQAGK